LEKSAVEAYLKHRAVVNVDSFYRCRKFNFTDRAACVQLLRSRGYVFEDVRIAHHPEIGKSLAEPYDRFRSSTIAAIEDNVDDPILEAIAPVEVIAPVAVKPDRNLIVLTSYLLKTHVYKPFFTNLIHFCETNGAQLIVLVHRYHNPTNNEQVENQNKTQWIDPIVAPYLCWERFDHGDFTVYADVRINPTNLNPLNPLRSTWRKHSIYGHTTQSLTTGNNSVNLDSPIAWCTGTLSQMDGADNLTAKKAEYHQRYGFLVCDGKSVRNVHARKHDGSFTDLSTTYYIDADDRPSMVPTKPTDVVWGDLHIGNHDIDALEWAIEQTANLDPKQIVLHDMFDGASINPHTEDEIERRDRYRSLSDEIDANYRVLNNIDLALAQRGCSAKLAVAESNHHQFIDRYLSTVKPQQLGRDDREILRRWLYGGFKAIFPSLIHLDYDYVSQGIRLGHHGHKGANGAKGSLMNDFQSSLRQIAGHTHIPAILGGSERVGCLCRLQQPYNKNSLSGWRHSIAIVQPGSKIQHLIRF
jgi:hypothetical protein